MKMGKAIRIGNKMIGAKTGAFIIAEVSANHRQSLELAVKTIRAAKNAGADAVKFQAYTPDTMTIDCNNKYFRIKHPKWGGQTLYELYKKASTPWRWLKKLKAVSEDLGMVFFATAFDKSSVDYLEDIGVPAHKIASFEIADLPLIEYVARTRKPLIISTGMAKFSEIKEAVKTAKAAGAKDVILLKCVSSYPADPGEANLNTIRHMERALSCPVGISDHTLGTAVSIAAVCMGAQVVEKHFILSRNIKTPDSFFSIDPSELKDLVQNIRIAQKAMGRVRYGLTTRERNNLIFRRSLFVISDIKKGDTFTEKNVRSIRPYNGLAPKYMKRVIGKRAKRDIARGTPLSWGSIA